MRQSRLQTSSRLLLQSLLWGTLVSPQATQTKDVEVDACVPFPIWISVSRVTCLWLSHGFPDASPWVSDDECGALCLETIPHGGTVTSGTSSWMRLCNVARNQKGCTWMQFYSGSKRLPVVSTDALTFNRWRFYCFDRLVNNFTYFNGPCFLRIFVRERIVHSGNVLCRNARLLLDGNAFDHLFVSWSFQHLWRVLDWSTLVWYWWGT